MTSLSPKGRSGKEAIILVVVTIICLVPFVGKAFHLDDPMFIWTAKQIQESPVNFYGFTVNWFGTEMPMAEVTRNPPLACYYTALVGSLFGYSEIVLHIAFLLPAIAAALGTYCLASQFCSRPMLATLAAVLTPGFIVSGTSIMCDIMMLGLWVWATVFWVRGIKENNNLGLYLSTILITACVLTKYFGAALVVLLIVYSLMQKRRLGVWTLFLLIPVSVLAIYEWGTYAYYSKGLLSEAVRAATYFSWKWTGSWGLLSKVLTSLAFTGGCVVTVLCYGPVLWSRRILAGSIILMASSIFALSFAADIGKFTLEDAGSFKWLFLLQLTLMVFGGLGLVALACADLYRHQDADSLLLGLWVLGIFIFAGFINWAVNGRTILPMIPAVGVLLARRLDHLNKIGRRPRLWGSTWPLAAAACVAMLVCWADYSFAGTARTAASEIHERFDSTDSKIWFTGHWGFQYYMEAKGHQALDFKNPQATAGDIIIVPSNNTFTGSLPRNVAYLREVIQFTPHRWAATTNTFLGAGFYSDIWGPLPFAFGPVEPEKYYVLVVK